MSTSEPLTKPESKLGNVGCVFGVLVGIISLVTAFFGPTTPWSSLPVTFYGVEFIGFIYLVPIWMLVMSLYFLSFWSSSNRILGMVAGLAGLASAALGLLTALQFFPLRLPFTGEWGAWLGGWMDATLISGVAILLFGLVYLKLYMSSSTRNIFGAATGLLFLVVGVFGILIGFAPGLIALTFFNDFSLIPWIYGVVLVPSLLGFKS